MNDKLLTKDEYILYLYRKLADCLYESGESLKHAGLQLQDIVMYLEEKGVKSKCRKK